VADSNDQPRESQIQTQRADSYKQSLGSYRNFTCDSDEKLSKLLPATIEAPQVFQVWEQNEPVINESGHHNQLGVVLHG
jgi:hypothetical protein